MIVLNNNKEMNMEQKPLSERKESYLDMFRKEMDAYCTYKEWAENTDDVVLEEALEEIMYDEYLHARFLREYMMENNMYTVDMNDPHERKFWKVHMKMSHK